MSTMSGILDGAAHAAELLGGAIAALLRVADPPGGWFDDTVDGGLGLVMAGLAGVAAAMLVALLFSIYVRTGYRSRRDMVAHGLAAAAVLALLAFAAYDFSHDALAYFGLKASAPITGTDPATGLLGSRANPPAPPAPAIKPLAI